MLPITPASQYLRPRAFVQEEWNAKFADGRANTDISKSTRRVPPQHTITGPVTNIHTY